MRKIIKLITSVLPIIISIIALFVSYLSYNTSKQSLEYEINKDMMIHTPAIEENIDSLELSFSLNNDNSEIQSMRITFPCSILEEPILVNTKPIKVSKHYLEQLAENYLCKFLETKDSVVTLGTFAIPIIIDYSAIVYGFPQSLRENRFFIFHFYSYDNAIKLGFSNTYLINIYGYPIKKHTFYTGPFSSPLEEKIKIQDQIDIQELLRGQLNEITKNLKQK